MKQELSSTRVWRISVLLTVVAVTLAYVSRGYFAIGGEWVVGMFPVILHMEKEYQ